MGETPKTALTYQRSGYPIPHAQCPMPKLDFLKQTIIAPIVGNIAIAFFSVLVMLLKTFFPNSISGTYLQLFF
ncbi:MAG: hypothetical protein V7L21_18660 [Nostoc sp.]|uniref:hypothetical protein n=1 Tax=unclassified Nostoc TaxID=2593658 RepID=UPI0025D2A7BC|nr:hypothetical protein [Nostoc sp. NMS9]MBN3942457.1 hypothetical protein [Nostoc sp. NMS9]